MSLAIYHGRLLRRDEDACATVAKKVFRAMKLGGVDVQLTFVIDAEMRALNRRWRNKDKPTDVLSLSSWGGDADEVFVAGDDKHMGDLVVAVETAARQARAHGHSLDVEIGVLVCHGLCHLTGLDHERGKADAELQLSVELGVLSAAGLPIEAGLIHRTTR